MDDIGKKTNGDVNSYGMLDPVYLIKCLDSNKTQNWIPLFTSDTINTFRAPVDSRLHFIAPERTTLSIIINKGVIYLSIYQLPQIWLAHSLSSSKMLLLDTCYQTTE